MARQTGVQVENSFKNGFVTEGTGLNFPENAVTETLNCIFDDDGSVFRRPGFDLEFGFQYEVEDREDKAVQTYLWQNVGSNSNISFVVVQIGAILKFYAVGQSGALSSSLNANEINLNTFLVSGASDPSLTECSFGNGLGYLFVTHDNCEPFYVQYNLATDDFTASAITVEIRDFEGVDDTLNVDQRPSTLSSLHRYNLFNQGWYESARYGDDGDILGTTNVVSAWDFLRSDYPANADIWWVYKGPQTSGDRTGTRAEIFRPAEYADTLALGNSPAPKGHYILELHRQDRSDVSGIGSIPVTSTGTNRVSCNAFYAGRVFYSGLSTTGFIGKVYFTQIIERDSQLGECFQLNDPTAEDNSDLLPSDGGVISITEAGRILKLVPVGFTLLVFATNGVWSISGSEGFGFRANDYSVRKVSSISTLSSSSFVDVDGVPLWWNSDGIYTVQQDQVGSTSIKNTSDERIRSFYQTIPIQSKTYAKGAYNRFSKTVEWLYRSGTEGTITSRYEYDSILVFNLLTGGFYIYQPSESDLKINGIVVVEGISTQSATEIVTNSALAVVTDSTLDPVEVEVFQEESFAPIFKYLVSDEDASSYRITFAEANNFNYVDWSNFEEGSVYDSYFITGFKITGEAIKKFQSTWIQLYFDNEDLPTVDFQGLWDYATSGNTGRWSSVQRISFADTRYSTVTTRRKVRGHGKALQFKIQSVESEPFKVVGWSTYYTVNGIP
jgi:hypothetical protein